MVDEKDPETESLGIVSVCDTCNAAIKENKIWQRLTPEHVEIVKAALPYLSKYDNRVTHGVCSVKCLMNGYGQSEEEAREICDSNEEQYLED